MATELATLGAGEHTGTHLGPISTLDLHLELHEVGAALVKKRSRTRSQHRTNPNLVATAIVHRVIQRMSCAGSIKLPAVPSMVDWYLELCRRVFAASGRGFSSQEHEPARRLLSESLTAAFARSNRSKIEIRFEAESAHPLGFTVIEDQRSLADAYERWIGASDGPLFGAHPDARVQKLTEQVADPPSHPILDFGAGTGRNTLDLARRGYPVDAVEITPKFAELLRQSTAAEGLPVRVVMQDVFRNADALRKDYWMLLASEVVPDFRGVEDLRRLFELAQAVLIEGGYLVFNVHVCAHGFTPEKAARELAQQCYSCLFTPGELAQAIGDLPFVLQSNDSVHDFERAHLPDEAWPPTPWYVNWTKGRDVYDVGNGDCPVEMRWLVFEKSAVGAARIEPRQLAPFDRSARGHFDSVSLRGAIEQRLLKRTSASGVLSVPAVPALRDTYGQLWLELVSALGRRVESSQSDAFRSDLGRMLDEAFERSQRSNVVLTYESPIGKDLRYTLTADPVALTAAYEQWHDALQESLFGQRADARLEIVAKAIVDPTRSRALDIGAGLGRNAVHLSRRGVMVDAVEPTSRFAEALRARAHDEMLPIQVIERDLFDAESELRGDYVLVLASGLVGDLRGEHGLRRLFEIAARCLLPSGHLLLNLHVASPDFDPNSLAREWAQQCCATLFTLDEIERCMQQLPFELESDDSALEFERTHLDADAWPPTPSFVEWASGMHMAALDRPQLPFELRWHLYRRT